jgi:hypothetical protein
MMAILAFGVTSNLQLARKIVEDAVRIPPSPPYNPEKAPFAF